MRASKINKLHGKEKKTSLIISIEKNDLKKFSKLISTPEIEIELFDVNGRTALMYAFFLGRIEMVNILLSKGASINNCDVSGRSLLDYYAESGNIEVVKFLLSVGAEIHYNYTLQQHCLNTMSQEMLETVFINYNKNKILTELEVEQKNNISNSVRVKYVNYLKNTDDWKQLRKYCSKLTNNQSEIRMLIYESFPEEMIDNNQIEIALKDCLNLKQYSKIEQLQEKGAQIYHKIFKKSDIEELSQNEEFRNVLFNIKSSELIKILTDPDISFYSSDIWHDYIKFLSVNKDYNNLKQFMCAVQTYSERIYNSIDEKEKTKIHGAIYQKVLSILPSEEKDQDFLQSVFLDINIGTQKTLINHGFILNYKTPDGEHILESINSDLIIFILKSISHEKLISTYSAEIFKEYFYSGYIELLHRQRNFKQLKKEYWKSGINREDKKLIYEYLPSEEVNKEIIEDLRKMYTNVVEEFLDLPKYLVELNDQQVIEVVKRYCNTSEYWLEEVKKAMIYQGVVIDYLYGISCSSCGGTGETINRNEPGRPCPICNGELELVNCSVERDSRVLWRL